MWVVSPASLFVDDLSAPDPASLFVDDLSAVTMGTAADVHMQDIVVLIEHREPWSNIYLNRDLSLIHI